jgi:hypothetical protein
MSNLRELPLAAVHQVRDTCLCLHAQRAARALARRFDEALRPLDLTNGQFSLLMSLNRPAAESERRPLLAMDRTTLTAALEPRTPRAGESFVDKQDKRGRRPSSPRRAIAAAFPVETDTCGNRALGRTVARTICARLPGASLTTGCIMGSTALGLFRSIDCIDCNAITLC